MSSCLLIILDVLGPLFLGLPVDFFWSGISPSGDSRNSLVYRCILLKLTPVRLCISLLEWPAWYRLVPAAIWSEDKCLLLPIYLYLRSKRAWVRSEKAPWRRGHMQLTSRKGWARDNHLPAAHLRQSWHHLIACYLVTTGQVVHNYI